MFTIRQMTEFDGEVYRDARLGALLDAPLAFASTHAEESARSDDDWKRLAKERSGGEQSMVFFAFNGEVCCGLVGCVLEPEIPGQAKIVSMWVAPNARRNGLGRLLLDTAEDWARKREVKQLSLDVTEGNAAASSLYLRCGFEFTGETEPYRNDPRLRELFMLKKL